MKLSLHRLVFCVLLLVATPFQGYASVAMIACEPSRAMSTSRPDIQTQEHGAKHHSDSMRHSKTRVQIALSRFSEATRNTKHAHDHQHSQDAQHTQTGDSHGESATQHSCCSACVVSALDGLMVLSQPLSNCTQFHYSSAPHLPPTLAGLERPPRNRLG